MSRKTLATNPQNLKMEIQEIERVLEDFLREIEEEKLNYRKLIDKVLEEKLGKTSTLVAEYHKPFIDIPKMKEDFEEDLMKYSEIMNKFNSDSDHMKGPIFVSFEYYIQDGLDLQPNSIEEKKNQIIQF